MTTPAPGDRPDRHTATTRRGRLGCRRSWRACGLTVVILTALTLYACGEDSDGQTAGDPAPAAVVSGSSVGSGAPAAGNGITVAGTGVVSTVPDQARFSFGVRSDGTTAQEALARASEATTAIVAALKDAGIDEADIQTQQVSVFPLYSDDTRRVSGYTASSSVSVLIRDLEGAGEIVDVAVGAGANEVFGPSLDVSDRDALVDEALGLAVEDARERASALATAAGVELGEITAISETGSPVTAFGASADVAVEESFAPIEPGTREVRATVTVTFAIA